MEDIAHKQIDRPGPPAAGQEDHVDEVEVLRKLALSHTDREMRRATLNLMDDVVDARQAAERENARRRRSDAALRENEAKLAEELADTKQLQAISGKLLQNDGTQALYDQILDAATVLMKSDAGSLHMADEETDDLILLASRGFHPDAVRLWEAVDGASDSSCARSLRTADRVIVPDIEACDFLAGGADLAALRKCGLRSVQTTPLISRGGRVVGMISTHWKIPHEASEREMKMLDLLARQAADLIERGTAEQAIRISEEKYRTLFETIDEGFCLIEMIHDGSGYPYDYRFIECNPAFGKHTGLHGAVGRTMRELAPDHEDHWFEIYGRIALTGQPERFEETARSLGRVFDVYAFRVGGPEQRRVALLFNDVTERKEREAQLAFLVDLSKGLSEISTTREAMELFGQRISELLDASVCAFIAIDDAMSVARISDEWRAEGAASLIGEYELRSYVTDEFGKLMSAEESVVVDDVAVDPRVENKEGFSALGIGAFVNVPLIRNGKWVFSIGVYRSQPKEWTENQVSLLAEISSRIWTRIERVRAQQATAADLRDTQVLRELGAKLLPNTDIQTLYDEINRAAMKLSNADGGAVQIFDPKSKELVLLAHHGFPDDGPTRFLRVDAASATSCGVALARGVRTFVDFDDPALDDPKGDLRWHFDAGYRSAQSTVLVGRSGRTIGMLTTHWREHRRPTEREQRYLDLLARQAADLIEQRQAEKKIGESEERLRTLFDSMNEAFVIKEAILDEDKRVVDYRFIECNPAFSRQTGLRDPRGHTVSGLMPQVEKLWLDNYEKVIRSGQPTQFEAYIASMDRWFAVSASRLGGPGSLRLATVFMDITGRKRSEEALKRVQEELEVRVTERTKDLGQALERLRAEAAERRKLEDARHDLLKRLVTTQEEERKRISRDLHDNLGQYLTAVMLNLQTLQSEMDRGMKPGKSFEDLKAIVEELMKAAHRQAWELRPTELDHFGLEAALRHYVGDWSERTGIAVDFQTSRWGDRRIPPDFEIALYRVVQEALTNVARHADASHVSVVLRREGGTNVVIADDGKGFNTSSVSQRLGLLGMKERLLLVGGTLEIESSPDHGTVVSAYVDDPNPEE